MLATPSLRKWTNKYKLAREGEKDEEKDEDIEKAKCIIFFNFLWWSQVYDLWWSQVESILGGIFRLLAWGKECVVQPQAVVTELTYDYHCAGQQQCPQLYSLIAYWLTDFPLLTWPDFVFQRFFSCSINILSVVCSLFSSNCMSHEDWKLQ